MSTKKQPIPRRRRYQVRLVEEFSTYFSVLAMTEEEAQRQAAAMAERQVFPPEAEESCHRTIDVWKGRA